MARNYLLTAWRNLLRNRVYSLINISGLALGLTCVMLIVLYVKDEVSYDRFHKHSDNIFRVVIGSRDPRTAGMQEWSITGFLQGPKFAAQVPGIRTFVRVQHGAADIRTAGGVQTQPFLYADANFFSVFSFPLLHGSAATALTSPHSAVISEDLAKRQFGTSEAVGKVLYLKTDDKFEPYAVTAVARRCPQNSSIQFDMVLPMEVPGDVESQPYVWQSFFLSTYVELTPNADKRAVEAGMTEAYRMDAAAVIRQEEKQYNRKDLTFYALQPLTAMHLDDSVQQFELANSSKPLYGYMLTGIAVFILLIACINFVNLTVARSLKRAREIGVRKVLGGDRKQLIGQFLGEAMLLCLLAFGAAVLLVQIVLPVFNQLSNKALAFSYLLDGRLIAAYAGIFLLTGLLAGFYPALVLSGFRPVQVLYGRWNFNGRNYLQKTLVVLQFGLSGFLIVGTVVIFSQFHYLTTEKLGYDDSRLVLVNKANLTRQEAKVFGEQLMKDPHIFGVAAKNDGGGRNPVKTGADSSVTCEIETVDEAFLPMLKIPFVAGRNFSGRFPSDSDRSVIVNEAFAKAAGWARPIGRQVDLGDSAKYTVIGVVKDYHFESLEKKIDPQVFCMRPANVFGMVYIKLRSGPSAAALRHIENTFRAMFPMSPYSYAFKDQQNYANYAAEEKWKQIMLFGALLTIGISCIGLFGLSVMAAGRRTKEIGIRKVLGASVVSVAGMLSADFLKLVGIAILIAFPAAWYAAARWLDNYPNGRITLSAWMFALAGLLMAAVALLTVSFQAVRAGTANPVKSLRVE
ncbi:MAG TPA: ABC transporter permease [Puia sp.]|nr:ABC transporter permease [Puia sp.]